MERIPITDFMAFVSNLLPHDKFKMFKTLFRYPVKTNEVTGVCFDKLSRNFPPGVQAHKPGNGTII
jgi:hypothetical protein